MPGLASGLFALPSRFCAVFVSFGQKSQLVLPVIRIVSPAVNRDKWFNADNGAVAARGNEI